MFIQVRSEIDNIFFYSFMGFERSRGTGFSFFKEYEQADVLMHFLMKEFFAPRKMHKKIQ